MKNFNENSPNGNKIDFLIEDKIIIDLKAKNFITKEDYIQMQRYLKSANLDLGLIINFRNSHLKPKRVLNSAFYSDNSDLKSIYSNRLGFTFIEIVIYLAIIGAVVSSFISYGLSIAETRNKNYVVQEVQANNRVAVDLIGQKIREAAGVNVAVSVFDTNPGMLSLAMAEAAKNPTIISLDQGRLQITEGTGTAVPVTSDNLNVSNLVFTNLTPSGERENIKIQLTIEYNNPAGDTEFNYSQDVQTAVNVRQ